MHTIRLLPFETRSGAANMAADEAMLHTAAKSGLASLRWYQWSEPTLSLGYFQAAADRLSDTELAQLAWVRRASGGSALVHHHEVTYALALPPGSDWQPRGESWACRVHHAIAETLATLGAATHAVICGEERKLGPVLCFYDQTPGDLLAQSRKVVGSAQRKQKGALLQHGGILLARSRFTPNLPGIQELTGQRLAAETVAHAVTKRLAEKWDWNIEPGDWTPDEQILQQKFQKERYTNPYWNEKR